MVVPVPNGANNGEHVTWNPVSLGQRRDLPGRQDPGEDIQLLGEGPSRSARRRRPSQRPEPTADPTLHVPGASVSPAPELSVSPAGVRESRAGVACESRRAVRESPADARVRAGVACESRARAQPDDPQLPVVQPTATSSASL